MEPSSGRTNSADTLSWTASPHICETISFCCLSSCLWQLPQQTKAPLLSEGPELRHQVHSVLVGVTILRGWDREETRNTLGKALTDWLTRSPLTPNILTQCCHSLQHTLAHICLCVSHFQDPSFLLLQLHNTCLGKGRTSVLEIAMFNIIAPDFKNATAVY